MLHQVGPRDHQIGIRSLLAMAGGITLSTGLALANPPPAITVPDIGPQDRSPDRPKIEGHWGEDAVGISWQESDSVDGRWNETDIGPFLASVLPTPTGTIAKGLSIQLYRNGKRLGAVGYDTQTMTCRVAWTGGFLKFDPARYGIIRAPRIAGEPIWLQRRNAWGEADVQYLGLFQRGRTVVLQYDVDGTRVREMPSMTYKNGQPVLRRDFEIEASDTELALYLARPSGLVGQSSDVVMDVASPTCRVRPRKSRVRFATFTGESRDDESSAHIEVTTASTAADVKNDPKTTSPRSHSPTLIGIAEGYKSAKADFESFPSSPSDPGNLLWPEVLQTVGVLSPDNAPLVVDTITLPFDNPYKALLFVGGHDFFSDGRAAVCTLHGDVWLVTGLDHNLGDVRWKRFATGLHQPLGLRIVDDQIYVLGRDQITRLYDRDANGEADYYECFSNAGVTSIGGHDYAAGLETDADGNFYYVRAHTGVMQVTKDGRSEKSIAAGLRNPAGLGVGPNDVIVASPQEGEWTPASAVFEVQSGGWYGYGGPKVTPQRPLGYDPPLCWTPRLIDNSTGGQVWVPDELWGPLQGQLLTLSFGRCAILLTLRDHVNGVTQGGNVPLDLHFESGLMRGRFHPHDGQLYVSGLKGWVSNAIRDGCLQRVRYTGQPLNQPTKLEVFDNGLALKFTDPLHRPTVQDIDNYHLEQWNYRYSPAYGSDEYRASQPQKPGRDEVELQSASLADDGRTVLLEIADLRPVMQMKVSYTLQSSSGTPIQNSVYHTINVVPRRRLTPQVIEVAAVARPGRLDREVRQRLKSGLVVQFRREAKTGTLTDARRARLAALAIPAAEPPSSLLGRGAYDLSMSGYLRSRLKGDVQFWIDGPSNVTLEINDEVIEVGQWNPNEGPRPSESPQAVALSRGYNRIEVSGQADDNEECRFRLMWSSSEVLPEPIPSTALFYDSQNQQLQAADEQRASRDRFATLRCIRCHAIPRAPDPAVAMPELAWEAPRLDNLAKRVRPAWLMRWLIKPRSLRRAATMPHVLPNTDEGHGEAADLIAFLMGDAATPSDVEHEPNEAVIEQGLELYETRGCLACHRFTPPGEPDEYDRLSLHFADAKFPAGQLAAFLREPHQYYAATGMPDFGLEQSEAEAIAAYVRSCSEGELSAMSVSATDPDRGKALFAQRRCDQCHALAAETIGPAPFGSLFESANQRGCLAADPQLRGSAPDFGFDDDQRAALLRFLRGGDQSLRVRVQGEIADRLMRRLRCLACHDRDQEYSPLPDILADEGELGLEYERVPNLGLAGEKLRLEWLQRQFDGTLDYRPRPWLRMRMPAFAHVATLFPKSLAADHGLPADELVEHQEPPSDLVAIGEQLSTKAKGFDCLQCHSIGEKFLVLENKANGVGLSFISGRLRKEFYHRWVRDPLRIDPLTKMPKFSVDGVVSQRTEYFDGDAHQQFEALWQYLRSLEMTRLRMVGGDQ